MKAAVLHAVDTPLAIEDVQIDNPGPREVLIRTGASGVCHSDLHFVEGKYRMHMPAVLGHEAAGTVEAVGSQVSYVQPGDRVIMCLSVFCGHCENCLRGRPVLCDRIDVVRSRSDPPRLKQEDTPVTQMAELGSFAEQMLVHEHAVVKVDDDMPFEQLALIGCGVTTGLGAALNTAKVEPGSTVAVIGCGGVGLNAIQGAKLMNASRIIAVDIFDHKLEFTYKFGATDVVNSRDVDAVEAIRELTGGGVDMAFDTFGSPQTTAQSVNALRKNGTAVQVGLAPMGETAPIDIVDMVRNQKTLTGSYYGSVSPHETFSKIVDFYTRGLLDIESLITRHYNLDQINEGFDALARGEDARGVILY